MASPIHVPRARAMSTGVGGGPQGIYETFLITSAVLGIPQPFAMPPPPCELDAGAAAAAADAALEPALQADPSGDGVARAAVTREALLRQLASFGIAEAPLSQLMATGRAAGAASSALAQHARVLKGMAPAQRASHMPRSLLNCALERSKASSILDADRNVYFWLSAEQPRKQKEFLLAARHRAFKATSNFLVSLDELNTGKDCPALVGKIRGNAAKTQYVVYDTDGGADDADDGARTGVSAAATAGASGGADERTELAVVAYQPGSGGPRKMLAILPKTDADGRPLRTYRPRVPEESMFEHWKQDPAQFLTLETKEPTWNEALRSYQLNFRGRVTCQSVKNFQLVEVSQPGRVVLQVGKRGDDDFVCDYQAPLNAFLALSIALTAFDGGVVRD